MSSTCHRFATNVLFAAGLFAAVGLSSEKATAQCSKPCFAMFDDATFAARSSTSGRLILCVQFQVPRVVAAKRLELFTGGSSGTTKLSLWSHDKSKNTPRALLSLGSYTQSTSKTWQGANLAKTVILMPRILYWIGMEYQRASQISARRRAPNNSGQPYRASRDGGRTWGNEFRFWEWKFRIFCCTKQSPVFATFGSSCGPRGVAPQLSGSGLPVIGKTYSVDIRSTASNAPVILTLGVSKTRYGALKLPLDLTPFGAPRCTMLCSAEVMAVGKIAASRLARFRIPVPRDNALLGLRYYHQAWLVAPVANPLGVAFSNAAEVVIGP